MRSVVAGPVIGRAKSDGINGIKGGKMGIPYDLIGTGIAIILIALAIYEADIKGRIIILALTLLTFLLPALLRKAVLNLICFIARLLIGIGCYIYLKWQNAIQ